MHNGVQEEPPVAAMLAPAAVSAPGKALVIGGFLVLEKPNAGCVLSLSARVTCQAQALGEPGVLRVSAPQLGAAAARYALDAAALTLRALEGAPPNAFVELAALYALSLGSAAARARVVAHGLQLTVRADNDFYSQRAALAAVAKAGAAGEVGVAGAATAVALRALPPLLPCMGGAKTGLGSSAAVVASVAAAVLQHAGAVDFGRGGGAAEIAHRVAQLAHSQVRGGGAAAAGDDAGAGAGATAAGGLLQLLLVQVAAHRCCH